MPSNADAGDVAAPPQQYWADATRPYEFVPVQSFADAFEASEAGRANAAALAQPLRPHQGLDALVRTKYVLLFFSYLHIYKFPCPSGSSI